MQAFKSKSYPISIILGHEKGNRRGSGGKKKASITSIKDSVKSTIDSETSAGEEDFGDTVKGSKMPKMPAG